MIIRYNGNKTTHLTVTIPAITLVFIKLFSKAKNTNVHFKIWTKETIIQGEYINWYVRKRNIRDLWTETNSKSVTSVLPKINIWHKQIPSWWSNWYNTYNCQILLRNKLSQILSAKSCIASMLKILDGIISDSL